MSVLFRRDGGRPRRTGGIIGYPLDRIFEEVAYIGYHMGWPPDTVLSMEHADRLRWVAEVSQINLRFASAAETEN
ncbi:MAG: DUF6760 family protein [Dehalococcoidia bacterium]